MGDCAHTPNAIILVFGVDSIVMQQVTLRYTKSPANIRNLVLLYSERQSALSLQSSHCIAHCIVCCISYYSDQSLFLHFFFSMLLLLLLLLIFFFFTFLSVNSESN